MMVWYEVKHRFKQISNKNKIFLVLLFLFQTGYFLHLFEVTSKNLRLLQQAMVVSVWQLPFFLLLFMTLLEIFSQFQNIRFSKVIEFKVNLVMLILSVLFCVGIMFVILVISIFKDNNFDKNIIVLLDYMLRYIEMFTTIGAAEWFGYSLTNKKGLVVGLILAFFVGASFYQSEKFLHIVFGLVYYDLNSNVGLILSKFLFAAGASTCLIVATNYLTMRKESLKE